MLGVRKVFERNIYDEYKLYCEQRFMLGDYEGFTAHNKHYFLVCVDDIEDNEITEMIKMGNHLQTQGDHEVAQFVPNVHQALTGFIDGQNCVLFQLPQYYSRSKKTKSFGYGLARFHKRGKGYPKEKNHEVIWSKLWINHLSQLDLLYNNLAHKKHKTSFDQTFMISFPYYLGRTENAIQYIVDTELDFPQQSQYEQKTICHYQFSNRTWLTLDERTGAGVKSPIDFVYDHPSRDIAEWIRVILRENDNDHSNVKKFIYDYEKFEVIQPKAWRYIYGRLLFPIEYFKIIEGYYRSVSDDRKDEFTQKLFELFYHEKKTEEFLKEFHKKIIPTSLQHYVPKVEWLTNQNDHLSFNNRANYNIY